MVTTKQTPRVDPQKTKQGETEYTTKGNNQFRKGGRNGGKKQKWKYKIIRKQLIRWHNKSLCVNNYSICKSNSSNERHRVAG